MFRPSLTEFGLRRQRGSYTPRFEVLEERALLSVSAAFVAKAVPDHAVEPLNASFTQTFTVRNTGTTTWSGYSVVIVSASDKLGSPSSVPIPMTAPGGTVSVSVPLKAVKTPGSGAAQLAFWEIRNGTTVATISGTNTQVPAAQNKLWTSITVNTALYGPMTPNLASVSYVSRTLNPFVGIGNGGQCTAYAWARAYEVRGVSLPCTGAAGQSWINAAKNAGYKVDMTPTANSIAVWSGHVAYVEGTGTSTVNGKTVTNVFLTEANWDSYRSYEAVNDPLQTATTGWGGGYDGAPKQFTTSQMASRGGFALLGYIHI